MTFEARLARALAILQQRGRVTYRALRRQFNLDGAALEELKDAMRVASPYVVEEEGRSFLWSGVPAPPADLTVAPPLGVAHQSPGFHLPDAERRHLTVLFCDLVASTALSGRLDPEEYREVIRAYQHVCAEVVQRFDGHIAQLLGDALVVYCGWPRAHEDDAQRAVRTGLGLLEAMGPLNTRLERTCGIRLAVRVGIHTGLVVVGEMGRGEHQEQLALGETPNIAARLQGVAAPDTVLLSADTYHLVQGYFRVEDRGLQSLPGVATPLHVYRVLGSSAAQSRLEVAALRGLTPLVGRESEVNLLLERWQQGKEGPRHLVFLSGEPGIGKSRLVQVLQDHLAGDPHVHLACRCSPYEQHTALYPLIDLVEQATGWHREETAEEKLAKLERLLSQGSLPLADTVPFFAPLLSLPLPPERYPQPQMTPQRQRQRTLETVLAWIIDQASQQPLLFIVEDLHWADPSTLELLQMLLHQGATARGLTLLTCRTEFQLPWDVPTPLTSLVLPRLPQPHIERVMTLLTGGKTLPPEVVEHLVNKADGIPLFIEEMTKTLLESGLLRETDTRYEATEPLPPFAIPATLHDSLLARLDNLGTAKGVAQLGATLGRRFSYELLQAVAHVDDATLQYELGRLVDADLLYQQWWPPQATYTFKHALVQEAAYQSLLKRTRQQYHQRTAQVLEAQFPATSAMHPELLAHHYTEAGRAADAITYWAMAGQRALQRSANVEAMAHFTQGLALLATLPEDAERQRLELRLQTALGSVLIATRGYAAAEVERTYARARALCQHVQDVAQLSQSLWGLWGFYLVRGELHTAQELAEQLDTLGQRGHDPALCLEVHRRLGIIAFYRGDIVASRSHFAQGIVDAERQPPPALMTPHQVVSDPGIVCRAFLALALWMLGYPEQALRQSQAALRLARDLAHPFTLALALFYSSRLHWCRGEGSATQERVEALLTLAREQGFTQWVMEGTMLRGGALVAQGHTTEGLEQMQQGWAVWHATAGRLGAPWYLALLGQAYGAMGQPEPALQWLRDALAIIDATGERWWEAEIHRRIGELLLHASDPERAWSPVNVALVAGQQSVAEAEQCFRRALDIAQRQQAKALEIRAAMSLSRLWQQQGKGPAARQLLAPIYGWFTEGFDMADLQEARALLTELTA